MNCQGLKVAFAGTPEFAAVTLDALLKSKHQVVGVLTQPDRPSGRGRKVTSSAVKLRALDAGVPVLQPLSLRQQDAVDLVAALGADVLVVVAYGLILPANVLNLPELGCLNIHGSLLPRWRGAAPIHRAVLAGDAMTGVSIMQMDQGLDTGDVLLTKELAIENDESVAQLHDRLAALGAEALLETLPLRCVGELIPTPQPEEGVIYAEKLSKAEAQLDFNRSSEELHRCVRAFNPWPVAEAQLCEQRVRIWRSRLVHTQGSERENSIAVGTITEVLNDAVRVKTGDGYLDFLTLQWPGKKAQDSAAFSQGRVLLGQKFSCI
ncbi:MAG: methionyl-tRNA formyltransferase [Granulosicoccus sp.]|jgi:methionyl-tRNA formyltransferase